MLINLYAAVGGGSLCLLEIRALVSIFQGNANQKPNPALIYLMPILLLIPLLTGLRSYRKLMGSIKTSDESQITRKSVRFAVVAIVAMAYVVLLVQLTTLS